MSDSLRLHGLQLTRLLCLWDFPGKSTGVGCRFLLQGIFPTQGSNLSLPHCRQTLYPLSHQGSHLKALRYKHAPGVNVTGRDSLQRRERSSFRGGVLKEGRGTLWRTGRVEGRSPRSLWALKGRKEAKHSHNPLLKPIQKNYSLQKPHFPTLTGEVLLNEEIFFFFWLHFKARWICFLRVCSVVSDSLRSYGL